MISFLSDWKLYLLSFALIGILTYAGLLKYQNIKLVAQSQVCNANLTAINAAVQAANQLRAQQERNLKLTEREAANAQAESKRRMDNTLNTVITGGCNGANDFLINYALNFQWDNNIP